jgi:hypothetical protein
MRAANTVTRGLLLVTALLGAHPVWGQSASGTQPSLDDLKAPPSPAFVLLGVSPSKIERPQAVRPFVLSALSALATEGFPKNYAVEVAPYWLGTPQLSFDEYYKSGIAKAIPRHLSVSVATTPLNGVADAGTALGIGARTLPVPGRPHPRLEALRKQLHELQRMTIDEEGFFGRRQRLILLLQEAQGASVAATTAELASESFEELIDRMIEFDMAVVKLEIELDDIKSELEGVPSLPSSRRAARESALKTQQAEVQKKLEGVRTQRRSLAKETVAAVKTSDLAATIATEKLFEVIVGRYDQQQKVRAVKIAADLRTTALAIQELDTQRVGPLLAVATALAWDIPDNETSRVSLSKVGVWVTPGYRMVACSGEGAQQRCSTSLDVLGVVRYLDDRHDTADGSTWELGARLVWQARTKLALSAEWLGRTADNDQGSRIVGVAEYEVNESAFLYASFGRDFEEKDVRRNLVSTIGLTLGFGKKPIITDRP